VAGWNEVAGAVDEKPHPSEMRSEAPCAEYFWHIALQQRNGLNKPYHRIKSSLRFCALKFAMWALMIKSQVEFALFAHRFRIMAESAQLLLVYYLSGYRRVELTTTQLAIVILWSQTLVQRREWSTRLNATTNRK